MSARSLWISEYMEAVETTQQGQGSWSELSSQSRLLSWQLQGKGFGCSAALGTLPDFPSLGFLICEMEMIDSLCPGHKDWGSLL